jgi:hypothetical protein
MYSQSINQQGIPGKHRAQSWKLLSRSSTDQLKDRTKVNYEVIDFSHFCSSFLIKHEQKLLNQPSEHEGQINKDVVRTFPENILMQQPEM